MYNSCVGAKVGYWAPVGVGYGPIFRKAVSPTIGSLGNISIGGGGTLLVLAGLTYFIFRKK